MPQLLICDPACVQPFGHNVTALNYFKSAFNDDYSSISAVCCKLLSGEIIEKYRFFPFYNFYYPSFLQSVRPPHDLQLSQLTSQFLSADHIEDIATADAVELLNTFSVSKEDDVLFPHLDFYGVIGMLNAITLRPVEARPRLLLRFIGVMENASHTYRSPLEELLTRIEVAMEDGFELSISAETARYSDYLARRLRTVVTTTGYPDNNSIMPMRKAGPFTVLCPGSARLDKGFLELRGIFEAVRALDPDLTIQFISQILPSHELKRHSIETIKLYAIPGVQLRPSAVSEHEMEAMFAESHAVLLPYAIDTYELRGSAVLMEATAFGRPTITFSGTAFSELVRYYNLGCVVDDQREMVAKIIELSRQDRDKLEVTARQARHRYRSDNLSSYNNWMKSR